MADAVGGGGGVPCAAGGSLRRLNCGERPMIWTRKLISSTGAGRIAVLVDALVGLWKALAMISPRYLVQRRAVPGSSNSRLKAWPI